MAGRRLDVRAGDSCNPDEVGSVHVALTALAAPGDRGRCLACGMDDYITKPLQLPDLVRALRWREARPE